MAIIKGFSGDVTITVGETTISFTDYGEPAGAVGYTVTAGTNAVLIDPTNPDSIEIVTPPERGKLVARSDGKMSLNLDGTARNSTNMTATYNRTTGGTTEQVSATITVNENLYKKGGWQVPKQYMLEVDSNDSIIVDPAEDVRDIYISATGLSYDDIEARHINSGDDLDTSARPMPRAALNDGTEARDDSGDGVTTPGNVIVGTYYGENEALALDAEAGLRILSDIVNTEDYGQYRIWFKRGDTFTGNPFSIFQQAGGRSISALHPHSIGMYGTGDRPKIVSSTATGLEGISLGDFVSNFVIQDLDLTRCEIYFAAGKNQIVNNIKVQNGKISAVGGSSSHPIEGATIRNLHSRDAVSLVPKDADWGTDNQANIFEAIYGARINGFLIENVFASGAGWGYSTGYRPDGEFAVSGAGKPPETFSHSIYLGSLSSNVRVKDTMLLHGQHSTMQLRCGAALSDVFALGHNTGLAPIGNGPNSPEANGGRGTDGCNYSMVYRYVQTEAGDKDWDGSADPNGGGISIGANDVTVMDTIVINRGSKPAWTDPTVVTVGGPDPDRGSTGGNMNFPFNLSAADAGAAMPLAGSTTRDEYIASGWRRDIEGNEDRMMDGTTNFPINEAARDALLIGDYEDIKSSANGSDSNTFDARMRTLDAPWEEIPDVQNYFLDPFGFGITPRSVLQTVKFQPDAGGSTPAQLADFGLDWDTGDVPGTVAGDSIDLDGHLVYWNITPKNSVANFTFGAGGELQMLGGSLKPTGTVTVDGAGNSLSMKNGSKFDLTAYSSANVLDLSVCESRFSTRANVSNGVNVTAVGPAEVVVFDNGSLTIATGRHLEVSGHVLCGFDGTGGSPTLNIEGELSFQKATKFLVSGCTRYAHTGTKGGMLDGIGLPNVGDVVEGAISGATGVVSARIVRSSSSVDFYVDNVAGEFFGGEDLLGPTYVAEQFIGDSRNGLGSAGGDPDLVAIGNVGGRPEYTWATIREFRTGENGLASPSVTSTVTLGAGAAVTIDDTTRLDGDHLTLIDVDALTDGGATLPEGVSAVGGVLTYVKRDPVARIKGLVGIASHSVEIEQNFTNTITAYAVEGSSPAGFTVNGTTGVVDWTPTGNYDANVTIRGTHAGGTEDVVIALYATDAPKIIPLVGQSQFNAHEDETPAHEYKGVYVWKSSGVAEKATGPFLTDGDGRNMPGSWADLYSAANDSEVVLLVPTYAGSTGVDTQWNPVDGSQYSTSVSRVGAAKTAFPNAPAIDTVLGAHGGAATSGTEAQMMIDMETFIDAYMTDIGATADAVYLNGDIFNRGSSTNDELSAGIRSLALSRDRYAALDWYNGLRGVDDKHLTGRSMYFAAQRMYEAYVDMLGSDLPDAPQEPTHAGGGAFSLDWGIDVDAPALSPFGDDLRVDYNPFKGRLPSTVTLYYTVNGGGEQSQTFAYSYQGTYQVPGLIGGEALVVQATVTNANGESARSDPTSGPA